jgi:hypothetical protein
LEQASQSFNKRDEFLVSHWPLSSAGKNLTQLELKFSKIILMKRSPSVVIIKHTKKKGPNIQSHLFPVTVRRQSPRIQFRRRPLPYLNIAPAFFPPKLALSLSTTVLQTEPSQPT